VKNRQVYMDHAATTPGHPQVLEAMLPYFSERFGNPSGLYSLGREAGKAIDESRASVAEVLGCTPGEVIFTSGGTESDSAAIRGAAFALKEKGNHIITSAVEHHAVINTCKALEGLGFDVTYLPVDRYGLVSPGDLENAIGGRTVLVSIMLANNEIGTVEPVPELVRAARSKKPDVVFHTDAVQGAGALDINVGRLGVDLLSLGAHKFHGPKGVGILYLRDGTPFVPQQAGGGQEKKRRAGTENVPGVVGAAKALQITAENREAYNRHCSSLRNRLIEEIFKEVEGAVLNGHPEQRLPNNVNVSFRYVVGEAILMNLDLMGIAASTGSACATGAAEPSHVLLAIGLTPELAYGSLRLTVGPDNSQEDVDYVLSVLPGIVGRLQAMSPLATMAEGGGEAGV
jgi:cysteine desulfurase